MLADWQISKAYFSELLKSWYPKVFERIESTLMAHNIPIELMSHTKDIWARDYMPIALSNGSFVQYNYQPDYLTKERKYQSDPPLVSSNLELLITKCPLIIDGGNVVKSEKAVIMTDKVFSENSSQFSKQEVIDLLKTHFGISEIYFIPWDKDAEEYGHSDGIVRFIDNDTILVNHDYKNESWVNALSEHFQIRIFESGRNIDEQTMNWSYINFLQTKDIILVPGIGRKKLDNEALAEIKTHFPDYAKRNAVHQILMPSVIKKGGALNCVSWGTN